MKKLFLLVVCMMSVIFADAQSGITWNAKLGLGASSWMGSGADGAKAIFNPRIGVGIDVPLTGWVSFQTGLNWVSKGAKYKMGNAKETINQNYFEMPLLAAFHIGTPKNFDIVLTGGAYIGCGVVGKTEYKMDDLTASWATFKDSYVQGQRIDEGLNRFDAGIQAGVALDFRPIIVGIDGEFGLTRLAKNGPRDLGIFATVGYQF